MVSLKQFFRSALLGSFLMALVLTIAGYLPNADVPGHPGLLLRAWAGLALWSGMALGLMHCGQAASLRERFGYQATVLVLMGLWTLFAGAHGVYGVMAESASALQLGLLALAVSVAMTQVEVVGVWFALLFKAAFGSRLSSAPLTRS